MTISEMTRELRLSLTPHTGASEAAAMSNVIMEDIKGYTPTQLLMYCDRELQPETVERIRRVARRICQGEPMQYVLGAARFRGRDFIVGPGVLIPRPETAQLVDMIVEDYRGVKDLRILDIGAGSGCIAISLAIDLPYPSVDAIDISETAIATSKANAVKLKANIKVAYADISDISSHALPRGRYDVIVSNPPYVLESEREGMDSRVKDYEPEEALFVSDDDPIGIYVYIARYAHAHLGEGGALYLEINPLCADSIRRMLVREGFADTVILLDYRGVKRFAKARL